MAKSTKKSSSKKNAKRVVEAASKYNSKNSKKQNIEVTAGVAKAAAESAAASRNKKQKKFYKVLCVIVVIAVVALTVYGYFNGWFDEFLNPTPFVPAEGELSIHFLELGNEFTGDSVYIKAGDTDILIDAGSRKGSAQTIGDYVDQYCTDGVLEYVIATHAHQDHIAGFVGESGAQGIFDRYECKTIIEFAGANTTSQVYQDYQTARDKEVAAGANCYTALDCVYNANGAQKVYDLTGNGDITMEVLYQKFYENKSSDENNYSVCVLITQGSNNYLFTGDLEADGEASLVENNPNLPEVVLFKGGHHGSYTSSTEKLLSQIKPQYVCVCCCAGTTEYTKGEVGPHTFPAQEFVDRIAKYTDKVYVTSLAVLSDSGKLTGATSMNGNIVFKCVDGTVSLNCSNNNTKLKDTDWFKNNRTCPDAWKDQE